MISKVSTVCPFCGCGCNLFLVVDGDRVIGVEPSPSNPVNRGMLCVKGWNAHEFVHSPDRLTSPLVRKGGKLSESTWEEALDLVAAEMSKISSRYGPRSLFFLSSAKATNEENFLFMKLARAVFKTNNVDHCARL